MSQHDRLTRLLTLACSTHRACRRRGTYRRRYASMRPWLMSFYDALARSNLLPAMPRRGDWYDVLLACESAPITVRLGTSDWAVLEEVFLRQVYAPVIDAAGPDVATILDLGSNIGTSVRFWHGAWPRARVLAVEPDPGNYELLQRNCASLRAEGAWQSHNACVAPRAGEAFLERSGGECGYHVVPKAGPHTIRVPAVAPLQLVEQLGAGGRIDLLKCDVEGAESSLFSACEAWIGRVQCAIVEVHGDYTAEDLERDLRRNGSRLRRLATTDPNLVLLVL